MTLADKKEHRHIADTLQICMRKLTWGSMLVISRYPPRWPHSPRKPLETVWNETNSTLVLAGCPMPISTCFPKKIINGYPFLFFLYNRAQTLNMCIVSPLNCCNLNLFSTKYARTTCKLYFTHRSYENVDGAYLEISTHLLSTQEGALILVNILLVNFVC